MASRKWTIAAAALAAAVLLGASPLPASAAPLAPRDLIFFLHYVNATESAKPLPASSSTWTYFDTTTQWNDVNVTIVANGSLQTFDWYLAPPLAGNVTVSAVSFSFWAQFLSGVSSGQTSVELRERAASGTETLVSTGNFGSESYAYTPSLKVLSWTLMSPHTFSVGSSIKLTLNLNLGGGSMAVLFDTARADSRVTMRTADALQVTGAQALDSDGAVVASLDPVANNTTARLRATFKNPLGSADISSVKMTVLTDAGSPVLDNASAFQVSGSPASFVSSFEADWNYSGLAPGRYVVLVFAMDNSGQSWYEHFATFDYGPYGDSTSFPVFIGGLPLHAWVHVTDDAGAPVSAARVTFLESPAGGGSGTTDAGGFVNLTAAPGLYTLTVTWEQTEVARFSQSLVANITPGAPLEVRAAVFYPTLRLVDNRSSALSNAAITYTPPNGTTTLTPVVTAPNGTAYFGRSAGGTYHVVARWQAVVVLDASWVVNSSGTTTLAARVFYADFWVLDSHGVGVAFAALVARENLSGLVLGYDTTNASGAATLRLPATVTDIAASTRDIHVVDARGVSIAADGRIDMAASVYYLELSVVDQSGVGLPGSQATVRSVGGTVTETQETNATGGVLLRLPASTYSLTVTWAGAAVASGTSILLASDVSLTVAVAVYGASFLALDSRGVPVAAATVVLRGPSGAAAATNLTGADGRAHLQAPSGNYSLEIVWRERVVFGEPVLALNDNLNQTVAVRVFYLTLHLVDSRGISLVDATVRAQNGSGEPVALGSTGPDGQAVLRLPGGSFVLTATWHNVSVLETLFDISADMGAQYSALVAHLTILVVDREGRPLHDAIVAVTRQNATEGALLAYTGADGTASFQVPAGRYDITARLIATYLLSPIDETERRAEDIAGADTNVTIVMVKFQPELVQTNAFAVALMFMFAMVALAAFVYFRYQRPGRPEGEDEEAKEAPAQKASPDERRP